MERKAKTGIAATAIIGIVFLGIGLVFLPLGLGLYISQKEMQKDAIVFLAVFGGVGSLFLLLGIIFIAMEIRKKIRSNKLLQAGNFLEAEFMEVSVNYNVRINGRHPLVVVCQYRDEEGNLHLFRSRNLYVDPEPFLQDKKIKVYVDENNFNNYYVDIDEMLPRIINH